MKVRDLHARAAESQRHDLLSPLSTSEEDFLNRRVPRSALSAFPDWQGLLIKSAVLGISIWVVRTRQEGEELARETGQPALLLDDVLGQKGKTPEEARTALLPMLILGTAQ